MIALSDKHLRSIFRKKKELSRLQSNKASEMKKVVEKQCKATSARNSILNRRGERVSKELITMNKKIADIEAKIARKEKEISAVEKKLQRENERKWKVKKQAENKKIKEEKKHMKEMQSTINQTHRLIENLKNIPEKITVLFMASNPLDEQSLRLDEEAREIELMIRKSEHRDSVCFVTKWAVRPLDILQAINEVQPTVIHFSGHGSDNHEMVLQDSNGKAKLVPKEAIVRSMMFTSDNIRLVFFNTCFSFGQAEAVTEHIDAAIGMKIEIGDDAARIFAAQFYSAIGFGFSIHKAFHQAKTALMLDNISEENTPQLYVKQGVDAGEIILVRP